MFRRIHQLLEHDVSYSRTDGLVQPCPSVLTPREHQEKKKSRVAFQRTPNERHGVFAGGWRVKPLPAPRRRFARPCPATRFSRARRRPPPPPPSVGYPRSNPYTRMALPTWNSASHSLGGAVGRARPCRRSKAAAGSGGSRLRCLAACPSPRLGECGTERAGAPRGASILRCGGAGAALSGRSRAAAGPAARPCRSDPLPSPRLTLTPFPFFACLLCRASSAGNVLSWR